MITSGKYPRLSRGRPGLDSPPGRLTRHLNKEILFSLFFRNVTLCYY